MTTRRKSEILDHARKLWVVFDTEAKSVDGGYRIWTGSLDKAREQADLSKGQFDKTIRYLKIMECLLTVQLGNRYRPSQYRLERAPDDESLRQFLLTDRRPSGTLEQRVNDLARQMGGVNLLELEARVASLEQKLNNTQGEIT